MANPNEQGELLEGLEQATRGAIKVVREMVRTVKRAQGGSSNPSSAVKIVHTGSFSFPVQSR